MQRSHEKEWMDLGLYTPAIYEDALFQLNRIGHFLGGNRATFWAFDQIKSAKSIVDVGCGGGLFTKLLANKYPDAHVTGSEISQEAVSFAKNLDLPKNLTFIQSQEIQPAEVVTATLVCHHLTDEELISFLKEAYDKAQKAVILNDLHRHILATIGFWIASHLFFRNPMIIHDGLLSIKRSFTRRDWEELLKASGIPKENCSITWHWAFRWIILIQK